jgi:hypothetical protein
MDAIRSNPEIGERIFNAVSNRSEDLYAGITSADQKVKRLSTSAKAEFFLDRIEKMPAQQLEQYLSVQQERGVLSDSVIKKMEEYRSFKDIYN